LSKKYNAISLKKSSTVKFEHDATTMDMMPFPFGQHGHDETSMDNMGMMQLPFGKLKA